MLRKTRAMNRETKINEILTEMPRHISTHLQFAQADTQTENCKRVEILPKHKDSIV